MSKDKLSFTTWLLDKTREQDVIGWVSRWFKSKCGEYLGKDFSHEEWEDIVRGKASKAYAVVIIEAFKKAYSEWEHSGEILEEEVLKEEPEGELESCIKWDEGYFITVRSTVARLNKIVKGNHEKGEIEEEEELTVTRFLSPPATVGVRQRLTTSYGGDWVQLGVMLAIPCYPEEIQSAYKFADSWVTERIREEVSKFKGGSLQDGLENNQVSDDTSVEDKTEDVSENVFENIEEESEKPKQYRETYVLNSEPEELALDPNEDFGL